MRLQEFDDAWKALEAAFLTKQNRYETLSNMGVTAKKQSNFPKAADLIAEALKLKPEGHMGLGDWYLKALRWRAEHENDTEQNPPTKNFLGKSYASTFPNAGYGSDHRRQPIPPTLQEPYVQLIRNDQSFADGFMTGGDALTFRGDLNLSFYAHTRAMMLGHQNPVEVERRLQAFTKYNETFGNTSKKDFRNQKNQDNAVKFAQEQINDGVAWLQQFNQAETDLLQGKSDEREVDFIQVEDELSRRGVKRVLPV